MEEQKREINYQKPSAEEIVAEVESKIKKRRFCKRCGRVTMHTGYKCSRCQ